VNTALAQRGYRDPAGISTGLRGEKPRGRAGAGGVDGAADISRSVLIGAETGGARAHLVVAQGRHPMVGQILGQLAHIADRPGDIVVAVAVGRPAFGDEQRRRLARLPGEVAVGAVQGQSVGDEGHLLVDPGPVGDAGPAAPGREHSCQRQPQNRGE